MRSEAIFFDTAFLFMTDSLEADFHLPQILANWVLFFFFFAASPLASNWIPQLFLLNSQTSEESQCKPQHRQKEGKEGGKREKQGAH